ncbi:AAA family ATPase [Gordonia lacunae]|uniref:ATP-binding protein n=1 Tax=Gordonia lacunae TaxID=417102 RepID=A0A243QCL0_9ACTN|nr:AAA family ATPase [Gordonia lacunae]OUC79372.1 ATP-binding protein [Gordonia lacunae]
MLIWINGAFGVGKTQTAHELHRRLPAAHVADPELLGFAMHKMLPPARRDDFQDLPQWRTGVTHTLLDAERSSGSPVIVPMTLVVGDYFDEIVGGLVESGVDVRHYTLSAPVEVIHRRLRARLAHRLGPILGADETWAMQQTERCVAALREDRFATHVPAGGRSVDQVVEHIADDAGLVLTRPRLTPVRHQLRRASVAVRHVRL